jgi:hypothetical protein
MAAERCAPGDIAAEDRPRLQLKKRSKKRVEAVTWWAWQPDRVNGRRTIDIDHNLKQNNQTIKILRDDRRIGGFEATTAFERGRAEEEEERGAWNALKRQEMN